MHLILIKNHTNAHLVNYTNVQQHCNTKRSILKISIPDKTFAEKNQITTQEKNVSTILCKIHGCMQWLKNQQNSLNQ
jgi:hypothetical protein